MILEMNQLKKKFIEFGSDFDYKENKENKDYKENQNQNHIKNPSIKENIIHIINKISGKDEIKITDKENLFLIFMGNLMFSLTHLMVKIISKTYPGTNGANISIFRYLMVLIFSYICMKVVNKEITKFNKIKRIYLFIARICTNFLLSISAANSVYYLRFGTSIALLRSSPFFVTILSVLIFKEKCLLRYFIGIIISLSAITLFSYGDLKSDFSDFNVKTKQILLGLSWSFIGILCNCFGITATKILLSEFDPLNLIVYLGFAGFILSLLLNLITLEIFQIILLYKFGFFFLSCLCGFFDFLTLFFMISNFKNNNLILVNTFSYFSIFLAFLYGILFFGEKITSNDFIAFFMLFGFSIYNIKYPPKRN
jgi:drug/metabolite transporter (DMT)-like permease